MYMICRTHTAQLPVCCVLAHNATAAGRGLMPFHVNAVYSDKNYMIMLFLVAAAGTTLPQEHVARCAACAIIMDRLLSALETNRAISQTADLAKPFHVAQRRWRRGERSAGQMAALDAELEIVCARDSFLASARLFRECQRLVEEHEDQMLQAVNASDMDQQAAVCASVVHHTCVHSVMAAAAKRFALVIRSEPEPTSPTFAGPRGLVRRYVRSELSEMATAPREHSLLLMMFARSASDGRGVASDAAVPPPYANAVSEFYKLADVCNGSIPELRFGQLDVTFNSPPAGITMASQGVQFALFPRGGGGSGPRPASLPAADEREDAFDGGGSDLQGVEADEVRRRLFQLLMSHLASHQRQALKKRVFWDLPSEVIASPIRAPPAANLDAVASSSSSSSSSSSRNGMPGVSSSGATAPLPPPCLACEALVSAVYAFLSSRRRTELEVFSAMDGVCDARSMGADMSAACHALLGTHGEALEAAIIGSRAGVLDGSDARQVCAKAGVDDCGPVGEGRGGVRKQRMTEEAAAAVEGRGTINPQVAAKTTVELPSERAARFDPLSEAASRSDGRGRAKRGRGSGSRGQGGAAAAATKAALAAAQRCEACGILAHEIAMRRAVEVAKSAREDLHGAYEGGRGGGSAAGASSRRQRRRETASAAALSRALEEAMDDTCEANAAFHVCDEASDARESAQQQQHQQDYEAAEQGASSSSKRRRSLLRRPGSEAYDWGACSGVTLRRCREVRDEHSDELQSSIRPWPSPPNEERPSPRYPSTYTDGWTPLVGEIQGAAVRACALVLDGCDEERAGMHLDALASAAAAALAEVASLTQPTAPTLRDEL